MLALQAIAVLNFGTTAKSTQAILPTEPIEIGNITVPSDRLWFAGIVVVIAAVLALVYRYTRFGLATRASAENEEGAALVGLSADRIGGGNWIIATILAGIAGILIAPVSTVDPTSYTLFIVPALGVALVARFNSFAIAAGAGLALGMLQSLTIKLLTVWDWLPERGVPQALPFVLIVVAMTLMSRGVGARGVVGELRNPSLGRPTRPYLTTAVCFVVGRDRPGAARGLAARGVHQLDRVRLPRAVARGADRLRRPGVARADVVRRPQRVRAQPPRPGRGHPVPDRPAARRARRGPARAADRPAGAAHPRRRTWRW